MAGKAKKKLDYAGWSVDIFDSDTKIDKLLDAQGWDGFSIYFYLCQRAFGSEGYFYRWGYDDCASTARKMGCGIGSGTIREVVGYCLQINLFDKRVFDRWKVLTSKGIQRSYWTVASGRRDRTVYKELWLLQKEECKGVVFVPFFEDMSETNDHSQATNGDMLATNGPVVKGSKVESNNKKRVAPPTEPATFLPESFEMQCVDKLIKSILDQMPNAKVPGTDCGRQKWAKEFERIQRLDHRDQEQIIQALDYAVKSAFWRTNIRSAEKFREKFETLFLQSRERPQRSDGQNPKNQFHNFDQRDTDYDALMIKQVQAWMEEEANEGDTHKNT